MASRCEAVSDMAQEPDNLVLVHLREMRGEIRGIKVQLQGIEAKLEEHDRRFDQIDRRFEQVDQRFEQFDKRFDDFQLLVSHSVGLGAINFARSRENEQRHEAIEAWQRRAEQRIDQIERRLAKVEEKPDT
jgi:archaellum component FlaC